MLEIKELTAGYGSLEVLHGISLMVPQGKIISLLGSNGAGKTTTMNAVAGLGGIRAGTVSLRGTRIDKWPAHKIFSAGMALVPQGRELFPDMTVGQNLELGGRKHTPDERARLIADVFGLFPRLRERIDQLAGTLSGGEQAMLTTARSIMSKPSLLLLDEPTAGLAPLVVNELAQALRKLNAAGQTILLVEQNIRMALAVSDFVYVMRSGRIVDSGPKERFTNDDAMLASYFG